MTISLRLQSVFACLGVLLSGFCTSSAIAAEIQTVPFEDGSTGILILGDITDGDAETFRREAARHDEAMVFIESYGGSILDAIEIGEAIRLRGFSTIVLADSTCASACSLIWLAGTPRVLEGSARVGFHAGYVDADGAMVESGVANALVGRYFTLLNLPTSAVVFATSAPPDGMNWLDRSNYLRFGIEALILENSSEEPVATPKPPPPINIAPAPPPIRTQPIPPPALDTASYLASMLRTPQVAYQAAQGIGAEGQVRDALARHYAIMFSDDAFIQLIADEIDSARIDPRTNLAAAAPILFAAATQSVFSGAKRLSSDDLALMFSYLSRTYRAADDTACIAMLTSESANPIEFETVHSLGAGELDNYLALIRRAVFAEIYEYPSVVELTASQIQSAENAWDQIFFDALLIGRSEAEALALIEALDNPNQNNASFACAATRIMFDTLNDMEGIVGNWMRRRFLSYVTDSL